ncbi:TolC family protein [Nitrosophilus labii]|uniref:TolC family protein n=1 Tax=Nitrosophilus labii TaxID=2706014 RepID=UPI001657237A|nr:TolC family protein [Nitrosophilus labii]
MRKLLLLPFLLINHIYALTLEEAIDTALKKSPLYQIQKEKILEAEEDKLSKKSKNFGKITLVGSYTQYNIPRTLAPIVPPITADIISSKDITSMGTIYEVMLFNGFADLSSVKIADINRHVSKIDLKLTKEQLIYNIKSLYYKILSLKNQKESSLSYKKALEKLYQDTKTGIKLGKKAKIDLLKVSSDMQNVIYSITNLEKNIQILKSKLAYLMGVDSIDELKPAEEAVSLNINDTKQTYVYKKSFLESKKAKKAIKKASSLYFPKISLNLYYGKNMAKGVEEELWQGGVNLNWNIFDFGYKKAEHQKAKISYLISKLKLKDTELKLKSDIEEAKNRIAIAKAKIVSTKKQLSLLKKIKETEKLKYEKGASDMYDLLYAIAKYEKAKSDLYEAIYDLSIQKAYLNYITAGEK